MLNNMARKFVHCFQHDNPGCQRHSKFKQILPSSASSGNCEPNSLSGKIKPQVEKKIGGHVSTNTIVASLKRVGDRLAKHAEPTYEVEKTPKNLKMSLSNSIIDVVP